MADQTYNLTQTGAEVQAIINDANGVKGAGATTSLTTDYIMLKDTSGAYHKIQKSSFTEAVRNTLASLLVNNDKGTTISQIAAIASGDFGSVTPANLASVLGGLRIVTNITDLNAVDYSCASTINGATVSNSPLNGWGSFISIKGNSYTSQLFIAGSNNALFYRNTNTGEWVRSYDSTMLTSPDLLSPLASALGVPGSKWYEKSGKPNTPTNLDIPVASGGIMVLNPTKTSASLVIAVNNDGVTQLNNTWYSNSLTFSVANSTVYVSWSQQTWEHVYVYRLA